MISENFKKILKEIPKNVILVVAAKNRSIEEIEKVISLGAQVIGENYVQEAEKKFNVIKDKVKWHLIGHLQKNKVKKAVKIFDMIETLDSVELVYLLDKECKKINKIMPVLVEVNIAYEERKSGVLPKDLKDFVNEVKDFSNLRLSGLMTMGPLVKNPEDIRPYFRETKKLFEDIKNILNSPDWIYLSMGMSDTYKIAIEEGANIVRIGTAIFGPRKM